MHLKRSHSAIAALAIFALTVPQGALAADCIKRSDLSDLFVYAMPPIIAAARDSCAMENTKHGFLPREGKALESRYKALQDKAWPGAKRAFLSFNDARNDQAKDTPKGPRRKPGMFGEFGGSGLLALMPDGLLRPILDSMINEKLAGKIKPESCDRVDGFAEAVAPLNPREAAGLFVAIMNLVEPGRPEICTLENK